MHLKAHWSRILSAVLMGVAVTTALSLLQPHFKARVVDEIA
jgi:hypothetical protein